MEEAVANLHEAIALYLSEFPLPGLDQPVSITFTLITPA